MSDKLKTYYIKTYGCQMNVSDAERIAGWYENKGWKLAKSISEADEIVIVTCSVRQTAEDRVYGLINNIVRRETKNVRRQRIILTGCMLRYPLRYLKEKLPQVDEFRKISEFQTGNWKLAIRNSSSHAFVPIMEGCNQFCSYCVVPSARGREKSRPFEEIICELKELAKRGYQEITLLGQNVNSYGHNFAKLLREIICELKELAKRGYQEITLLGQNVNSYGHNFAKLLREIHRIEGIKKISFLTSNPWDLTDEIIEAMKLPKIDRYLHLPVQSGDDEILKKMNRKYTAKQYLKLVEKIKKQIPKIKVGTDIIVGFPGEIEKQFQNTVDLCKKVGFVKAYIAMYSPRLGTAAFKLKDNVSHQEKKRRWKILDDLIN